GSYPHHSVLVTGRGRGRRVTVLGHENMGLLRTVRATVLSDLGSLGALSLDDLNKWGTVIRDSSLARCLDAEVPVVRVPRTVSVHMDRQVILLGTDEAVHVSLQRHTLSVTHTHFQTLEAKKPSDRERERDSDDEEDGVERPRRRGRPKGSRNRDHLMSTHIELGPGGRLRRRSARLHARAIDNFSDQFIPRGVHPDLSLSLSLSLSL
ncbi:hypothetical protein KIPB_013134, partial [Kipferlia bialata]